VVVAVGLVVAIVAGIGLGVQAVRGNTVVSVQRRATTVHDAALDNAFYRCLDVQAHSLVSAQEPVALSAAFVDFVTLIKAVGSWVTIANPLSTAKAQLTLRDNVTGGGACLGTVVVATYPTPHHGVRVRIGTGDSVPGAGPPPAPPL